MVKELDLSLDYKVKDLNLADFGRKEMQLSEREMPGLMECIRKYGPSKPLKGLRITGSLHMTIQTAMLIKTLVRARAPTSAGPPATSSPPRITPPRPSPTPGWPKSSPGRVKRLEDYWWCTEMAHDLAGWQRARTSLWTTAATPPCSSTRACEAEDDPSMLEQKPAS